VLIAALLVGNPAEPGLIDAGCIGTCCVVAGCAGADCDGEVFVWGGAGLIGVLLAAATCGGNGAGVGEVENNGG